MELEAEVKKYVKRYCNVIKNCIMEPGIEATACACELLYVYVVM